MRLKGRLLCNCDDIVVLRAICAPFIAARTVPDHSEYLDYDKSAAPIEVKRPVLKKAVPASHARVLFRCLRFRTMVLFAFMEVWSKEVTHTREQGP